MDFYNVKPFRYETQSGFVVETRNSVLPLFNADDRSIDWYSFVQPSHADSYLFLLSEQHMQAQHFSSDLSATFDLPAGDSYFFGLPQHELQMHSFNQDAVSADSTPLALFNSPTFVPCFYVRTAAKDHVQSSRPYFERYKNRIISQKHSRLRAGKDYFVSPCEQERIEASAKDHVTHFESLILSRDHSNPKFLSTVFRELKRFGRRWLKNSNSFGTRSNFWPRFTLPNGVCLSFDVACNLTN